MYTIESNVALPEESRKAKYPLASMQVGDSFAVSKQQTSSIRSAINYQQTRYGGKFTVRNLPNGECRIWRTA